MYRHKPWVIDAVGWTGTNFDEVKTFLRKHLGETVQPYRELSDVRTSRTHHWVKFTAYGRTWSVRDGSIIVVHVESPTPDRLEILNATEFKRSYDRI